MSVTAVEEALALGMSDQQARLRVVIFTNAWMMGGMERQILDLARGLTKRGHCLTVLCFATPALDPFRQELAGYGVDVVRLEGGTSALGRLRRFWQVLGVLRSHRGAVLHLIESWPVGDGLVILAAKLAGVRAIVSTETEYVAPLSMLRRLSVRIRDRFLERVVAVSRLNADSLAPPRDAAKITVITNGVDEERFDPARVDGSRVRALAGADEKSTVVGTMGRLRDPRKGLAYFVEMARRLRAERPQYRFVIAGEADSGDLGDATEYVTLLGRVPDAAAFYAGLDVFVLPSLSEGGPITVLEAMAVGCPVVSTRVGMVPDVITDGVTGRIVPPADAEALARAVSNLTRDLTEARRIGQSGRSRVLSEFTLDAIVERYVGLYRDLPTPALLS
jgi:glycosyltransferase involved in cell wall biosynthesis